MRIDPDVTVTSAAGVPLQHFASVPKGSDSHWGEMRAITNYWQWAKIASMFEERKESKESYMAIKGHKSCRRVL